MSFDKEESDGNVDLGLGLDLGPRIKTVSREYRVEAGGQVIMRENDNNKKSTQKVSEILIEVLVAKIL